MGRDDVTPLWSPDGRWIAFGRSPRSGSSVRPTEATRPRSPTRPSCSNWAKGAVAFAKQARSMAAALVDGRVGIVLAPGGRLSRAVTFTFAGDTIARVEVISDPTRIARLDIAVLDEV